MSKTFHNRRDRLAGLEGRVHHEHSAHDVCAFCGKKAKGKSKKRDYVAFHSELDRLTNPNQIIALLADEEG